MTQDPLFLISANLFAAVMLRCIKANLLSALVLAVVVIASGAYLSTHHGSTVLLAIYNARDHVMTQFGKPSKWPPERYRTYPDLSLLDQQGRWRRLSEFKGKVILVEPMAMTCPACVAFSGGQQFGPYQGTFPQPGLLSIDEYARDYGRISLHHPGIVVVQIVLFNPDMRAPSQEDIENWTKHFHLQPSQNRIVLGGGEELANDLSRGLIPGFQLIDRNFVLRMDSTGDHPVDNLYTALLPMIRELLDE